MEFETVWNGSVKGHNRGLLLVPADQPRESTDPECAIDDHVYERIAAAGLDGLTFDELRDIYVELSEKALRRCIRRLRDDHLITYTRSYRKARPMTWYAVGAAQEPV